MYEYYFEGETIDGSYITHYVGFEGCYNRTDADELAANEAETLLKEIGGGHIDVFYTTTDNFLFDVEV